MRISIFSRLAMGGLLSAAILGMPTQVQAQAPFNMFGLLDGSQAVPSTPSTAAGVTIQANIPLPFGQWMGAGFLSVIGIDGSQLDKTHGGNQTAVHIHSGAPGSAGPFIFDSGFWGTRADYLGGFLMLSVGFYTQYQGAHNTGLTTAQIVGILQSGDVFCNIHTQTYRPGEIRADLSIL
ncbi:MAG: CHRD domain-containing protein [Planctomycetota bacterium]